MYAVPPKVTVALPTGIPTSTHGSNSAKLNPDSPPLSLMSSSRLSYLPRSMLAQPPTVIEALPAGNVTYRSGCATGLLVRLRPRHTYELKRARSAPTVCAWRGPPAIALTTTRVAPRTFARLMVSPDAESG